MSEQIILQKLEIIEELLKTQTLLSKKVLNLQEACTYIGVSSSHMYKLTSSNQIPFYKPNGKRLFFNREELDSWMLQHRNQTQEEIEQLATSYVLHKGTFHLK